MHKITLMVIDQFVQLSEMPDLILFFDVVSSQIVVELRRVIDASFCIVYADGLLHVTRTFLEDVLNVHHAAGGATRVL